MANAVQGFRFTARRCRCRIATQAQATRSFDRRRQFNTSVSRLADEGDENIDVETLRANIPSVKDTLAQLASKPAERTKELDEGLAKLIQEHGRQVMRGVPEELRRAPPFKELRVEKPKPGLLNMGATPADEPEEDPEFQEDDISSLAHGELEQHREFRHYARLAAWEMPLLTKMAKPFVPPTQKEILRFRYTTYMGEEHPAEKKVVVEFCPGDMPDLTTVQLNKLKKLAGVRYNPETDIVKMSCEMFESQAQNKRYLGDLVDTLLREARDPTDTFEDIPLDLRHHPIKVKPKFPVEWRMTAERKAQLKTVRQQSQLADQQKSLEGAIVDGVRHIQAAFAEASEIAVAPEPQSVIAGKATTKGKKLKQRG